MFHNSKLSRSFWNFSWNIMSSNILCWLPCVNTKGKSPATTKGLRALPKVPFSVLPPYLRWPQCTCRSQAVCTAAVRDTQVMLTLIRLWRKTGKVLLKPKQNMCGKSSTSWLAHPKGGLAGAGSHSDPEAVDSLPSLWMQTVAPASSTELCSLSKACISESLVHLLASINSTIVSSL